MKITKTITFKGQAYEVAARPTQEGNAFGCTIEDNGLAALLDENHPCDKNTRIGDKITFPGYAKPEDSLIYGQKVLDLYESLARQIESTPADVCLCTENTEPDLVCAKYTPR